MSVMIGGVTERLAPDSDFMIWDNITNSSIVDDVARDAERVRVASAVTFLSGIFQVNAKTYFVLTSKTFGAMKKMIFPLWILAFLHTSGSQVTSNTPARCKHISLIK